MNTKRIQDETQPANATPAFTVAIGNSVRAGGKVYREGDTIPAGTLTAADAQRLTANGVLLAAEKAEKADSLTSGTAAEVIDSLEGMDDAQLQAVAQSENAREKPRKTVLEAIEAARAQLADAGTGEE